MSEETYPAGVTQLGVHRADLVAVLTAALPPGIVHTGHRCVRFSRHNEFAKVSFDNGVSVKADVVIAPDGIHSVLQRYVVDAIAPVFSGTVAYRGLIPASGLQEWPRYLVIWGAGGKHLLAFPCAAASCSTSLASFPPTSTCANPVQLQAIPRCWRLNSPTGIHSLGACLRTWTPHSRGDSMIASH